MYFVTATDCSRRIDFILGHKSDRFITNDAENSPNVSCPLIFCKKVKLSSDVNKYYELISCIVSLLSNDFWHDSVHFLSNDGFYRFHEKVSSI